MIRYSAVVTIDRSPDDVFTALLDARRYEEWTPMQDGRWEGTGEPGVGTRGSFRMPSGPVKGTFDAVIKEVDRPRRLVIELEHPALEWASVSTLEPVGAGTRVTYAGEIRLRGWRRLLEPFMAREVQTGEQREIERLKALLEGEASHTGGTSPTRALQP